VTRALPTIEIMGVPLAALTPDAALAETERLYEAGTPAALYHANAHTLNLAHSDPSYAEVLRRGALVLNDGKGMLLAARLVGRRFPADLNGNFFTPLLLGLAADRGWPVYFLGAKPGVAAAAAVLAEDRHPGLKVVGAHDGYVTPATEADVISEIKSSGAALLLVGMGNPYQERWLDRCLPATEARLGAGVGAFFDFQTGHVARAPGWMNRIGLEWLYRLGKEPGRLWRRYVVGNPLFVARVVRSRR
jgi:N-acetylglucosaminyldiphosphoundecaprenol N-acetyl-beta-D-mannosaminyltransferase